MLYFLQNIKTADISKKYGNAVCINGCNVSLVPQRVGFGYKRLFICPICGARRERLLMDEKGRLCCRGCCPVDPYADRRNLYDEGGQALILWHMRRTADKAGIELKFPFKYYDYVEMSMTLPPKKNAEFCEVLQRLQVLENMRFCAITWGASFTAADIKRFTAPQFAEQITLADWEKYILFRPGNDPQMIIDLINDVQ